MANYRHVITVTGRLPFPIDMLRYDRLAPMNEGDSLRIENTIHRACCRDRDSELVELIHIGVGAVGAGWRPTFARWESFGWRVTGHQTDKVR